MIEQNFRNILRVVSMNNTYEFLCRIWGKMPYLGPEDVSKYSLFLLLFVHSVLALCKTSGKFLEWVSKTICGSIWAQSEVKCPVLKSISVLPKYLFPTVVSYISHFFRKILGWILRILHETLGLIWGKICHFEGNSFFQNTHYRHFCFL